MGLSGGGGSLFCGSGVRKWAGLEVGVGLNSRGEGLCLTDSCTGHAQSYREKQR